MSKKVLLSIEIRCGEWEFSNKMHILDVPKGQSLKKAIKEEFCPEEVDGDTLWFDFGSYCYTITNEKVLTEKQVKTLSDLGIY